MVAQGKANGSPPADTLQKAYTDMQGYAINGQSVGWDYFSDTFDLGPPPGVPPPAQSLTPQQPFDADLNLTYLQLVVKLDTPLGSSTGVIVIYWGTFQRDTPADPDSGGWRIYVGVKAGAEHVIKEIPLVGALDDGAFAVRGIQALVTTNDMTAAECVAMYKVLMNQAPPTGELGATNYDKVPTPPLSGVNSRITIKADVQLVTLNVPLVVELGPPDPPPGGAPPGDQAGQLQAPSSSATVQQRLGPLSVNRIFSVCDEKTSTFGIGVNAGVDLGIVTLGLEGLTVSKVLTADTSDDYKFGLQAVALSGGIPDLAQFTGVLCIQSLDPPNMFGGLTIALPSSVGVSAMAGFAEVNSSKTFFLFGFVKVPIGGPPWLEVKGVALGGAYNRGLVIPDVSGLDKFPFIQAAMAFAYPKSNTLNPFPSDATSLDTLIKMFETLGTTTAPPKPGSYWVTAGIAFSSFKIVNGFALVSVAFGKSTQISAVGEMQLRLPPPVDGETVETTVFLDIFLRAVLDISNGELALDSYIKHNSYLIEKNGQLTGGFALRVWFGNSKHPGFLLSAGGYAPDLDLTDYSYYPAVPRIAMSMPLGDGIQVQSKMYFTVTSSMVMYGLAFQVSGKWGPARVWATLAFDGRLRWAPLQYNVNVVVEFGASFRIKVFFVHITITVHLGASLHIWGPPFSGRARLDLAICTVSFNLGANADTKQPLTWDEFKKKYLTDVPPEPPALVDENEQTKAVADIQLSSTPLIVLERQTLKDSKWVVDPENLVIRTISQIPSKSYSVTWTGKAQPSTGSATNTDFGVNPCAIDDDKFHTTHNVTIDATTKVDFTVTPQSETVPAALWKPGVQVAVGPGANVDGVLAGIELCPIHPPSDHTLPADAENLLEAHDKLSLRYFSANTDHSAVFNDTSVSGTIASARATANRQKLFSALEAHLLPGDTPDVDANSVDVSGFANGNDTDLFISPPRDQLLGQDQP